jgi:branched-chain amino acid transport system ATP-binding protein
MLTVTDVHTYYGDSHVLQGVTMTAQDGKVTAVLGRNGVGKTTLCRSLVGLTRARSGRIEFDGVDLAPLPPHVIAARRISLVPQGRRVFISLTVHENLAIAARSGRWTLDAVFELFPRLKERLANRGNELSGGEQQMLAIARALVSNPLLIIFDEPTEGLAPAVVSEVGRLIQRLRSEGMSILLAEQNAAFAVKLADYVHVMSKGRIVHSSDPDTLWRDEEIKTRLLGVPSRAQGTR